MHLLSCTSAADASTLAQDSRGTARLADPESSRCGPACWLLQLQCQVYPVSLVGCKQFEERLPGSGMKPALQRHSSCCSCRHSGGVQAVQGACISLRHGARPAPHSLEVPAGGLPPGQLLCRPAAPAGREAAAVPGSQAAVDQHHRPAGCAVRACGVEHQQCALHMSIALQSLLAHYLMGLAAASETPGQGYFGLQVPVA